MELQRFIEHEVAGYQVLVEFSDDEGALAFSEWLQDYGFKLFRSREEEA